MKEYKKLLYIFMILFLVSGCKILEKKATEIKNSFGKQSSEESIKKKIVLKLQFHVEKIVISKSTLKMGGLLNKNTQKKKFVHGKQLLPRKIAI